MDRADAPRPRQARERGVVMVITIMAIILIASLLFYVFNVGTSVQGRVVTQHAADATAIGGAGQVARSLNTVAMNNVETARLITAVSMLDSVPLAVDMSVTDASEEELGDIDALYQAITAQLRAGVIDTWFESMLREMVDPNSSDSVIAERDNLRQLDELFRTRPDLVPDMTEYRIRLGANAGEMGRLHQAMRTMDAHSRAVKERLSEMAQAAASNSARANLGFQDADNIGLLLPATINIPLRHGNFYDFERPVKYGLLPGSDTRLVDRRTDGSLGQVDDEITNRGPWDVLFGWRSTDGIDPDPGRLPGLSFPPQVGPPTTGRDPEEYRVYGPQSVMPGFFRDRTYTRIGWHGRGLYSIKSNYLWSDDTERTVLMPDWEIDFNYDGERSTDRNDTTVSDVESEVRETLVIIGEIKSQLADDDGLAQRRGLTWNTTGRRSPLVRYLGGWRNPQNGPPFRINPSAVKGAPTWKKLQDHIWRYSAVYETNPEGPDNGGDPSIGLPPRPAPGGGYLAQEVYWEINVMYVGVNIGEDVPVTNPWEGFDPNAEDAPAPVDLDHQRLPPNDQDARFRSLTFLGVSRQSNRPDMWPTRFQGDKPYPYNTAIAQARVFNNHSWDLWTQTWQTHLEPVDGDRFDEWVDLAFDAINDAAGQDAERVRAVAEHLDSVRELAPIMVNH